VCGTEALGIAAGVAARTAGSAGGAGEISKKGRLLVFGLVLRRCGLRSCILGQKRWVSSGPDCCAGTFLGVELKVRGDQAGKICRLRRRTGQGW